MTAARRALPAAAAAFVLALAAPVSARAAAPRMEFRLSGAWTRFRLEDVNASLRGYTRQIRAVAMQTPGWVLEGGGDVQLRDGYEMEAEAVLSLGRWGLGLASGFSFSETAEDFSPVSVIENGLRYRYSRPVKISGLPFIVSGHYELPLNESLRLFARAGAGWMRAKYFDRDAVHREGDPRFNYTERQSANGGGGILLGGVGLRYGRKTGPGFFLETIYRRCVATRFEGSTKAGVRGRLWSYQELDPWTDEWLPQLRIHAAAPEAGETIRNVAEARLDLSGLLVRLGIIVRF